MVSRQRSVRVDDPLRAINKRSREGRQILGLVDHWLGILGGSSDDIPLVRDLVALGELHIKAEQARADPNCSPASVAWVENALFRRMRQLGLTSRRSGHTKLVRS
jgi:hypothetical protein